MVDAKLGKAIFALVAVVALITSTSTYAFGFLTDVDTVNTSGVIADVTFGVYSDSACTNALTSVDWGVCYPGEGTSEILYVKNLGSVNVILSIQTANWSPSEASSFFTLSSNYSGEAIEQDGIVEVTLTFDVSPDIEGVETFNFDIMILSQG